MPLAFSCRSQADYVVHLAAAISVAESMKLPEKYMKNNVEGSMLVLDMYA